MQCVFFLTSNRWVRVYNISRLWDAKKSWFTNQLCCQFSKRTACLSNLKNTCNWIQKNSSDSQIILAVLESFFIQLFPNWTECSPITYTNSQRQLLLFLHKKGWLFEGGDYCKYFRLKGVIIRGGRAIIWGNMALFPVDSLIHLLNNWGQVSLSFYDLQSHLWWQLRIWMN